MIKFDIEIANDLTLIQNILHFNKNLLLLLLMSKLRLVNYS